MSDGHHLQSSISVRDLLKQRRSEGSKPGARGDSATLALVIEGGGMRGVVSAGMVTALDQLGFADAFDVVFGTSAGALAGAFFLSGEPAMGTSLYYEELISRDWLHYARALRRQPIVGLDWLLDEVMTHGQKALKWTKVTESATPLYAVATQRPDYIPVTLGPLRSVPELREALRASARIPLIAGAPVEIGDRNYIDGSITQGIPFRAASEMNFTHAMTLLTRPAGQLRGRPTLLHKAILFPLMNLILSGLGDAFSQRPDNYVRDLHEIEEAQMSPEPPSILVVQVPPTGVVVHQLERDPNVLFAGASTGAEAVYEALAEPVLNFFRGLSPVR